MPTDTTPDPRDMLRGPETPEFLEPKPGAGASRAKAAPGPEASAIERRPALPEHPEIMAADIEDEEEDPVVDSGPGIADGALNRG